MGGCALSPITRNNNANNADPDDQPPRPPNKLDLSLPLRQHHHGTLKSDAAGRTSFMVDWADTTVSVGLVGFQTIAGKTSLLTSALSNSTIKENWKPKWLNDPERLERKTEFFKSQLVVKARQLLDHSPIAMEDTTVIGRECRILINRNSTTDNVMSALSFLLDAGVFAAMDNTELCRVLNARHVFVDSDVAHALLNGTRIPNTRDAQYLREPSHGILEAKMDSIRIVDCPGFPRPLLVNPAAAVDVRSHPYMFQKWKPEAPHVMTVVVGLHAIYYNPNQLNLEARALRQLRQWAFDLAEIENSTGIFVSVVLTQIDTIPLQGQERVEFLKRVARTLVTIPQEPQPIPVTWEACQIPIRIAVANALDATSSRVAMMSIGTFQDEYLPLFSMATKFFDVGIVPHMDQDLSGSNCGDVYWARSVFPPLVLSNKDGEEQQAGKLIWHPSLHRLFSIHARTSLETVLCCFVRGKIRLPELVSHKIFEFMMSLDVI